MGKDLCIRSNRRRRRWRRPRRWSPRKSHGLTVIFLDFKLKCWYVPRRGYYPHALVRLGGGPIAGVLFAPPGFGAMKRKIVGGGPSSTLASHLAPLESAVFGKLFNLVSHCCVTKYDDGEPRQPGWFTVKTSGSAWVVQVKDPDGCCQMSAIGNTLDDALALADLLLGSDEAPWEPDPWAKRKATEKKK